MRFFNIFLLSILCFIFTVSAVSASDLNVSFHFARYGNSILAAMRYAIPQGYHAYAHDADSTGKPTELDFTLEDEGSIPVLYPQGREEKDIFDPSLIVPVYEDETTLLAVLPAGSTGKLYVAELQMLLCSNRNCRPVRESYTGSVPTVIPLLGDVAWKDNVLPLLANEGKALGALSLEKGRAPAPQLRKDRSSQTTPAPGARALPDNDGKDADFTLSIRPHYANAELEIYTLGKALLLGLLAGLILNAMPCVLPVLTIKVSGILLLGNLSDKKKVRLFRAHNLCFAAGIMTLFTALALVLGMADLMWGQLYQNHTLLVIMVLLVFLMGLSMLGVFTLPVFDLHAGAGSKNPCLQSYLTGLISTFLATPCSGPLLGAVLAWAFTQPLHTIIAIFWAVGLGMALPYLIFAVWPACVKILPQPGRWMYVLEHLLGFFLLGTALYLLSILPADKHMQTLGVLLALSLGAWLWGKFFNISAPLIRRRIGGVVAGCLIAASVFWLVQPPAPHPEWQKFSPQAFREDLGKKNMLVEFTADWCPNCKFLEATVLSASNMRSLQKRYNLELVRVDLTNSDSNAEKLLEMLGSKSIPLTAIFPGDASYDKPLVLRDIYGRKTLDRALLQVFGNSS